VFGLNVLGGRSHDFEVAYDEEIKNRTDPSLVHMKNSIDEFGTISNDVYQRKRDVILQDAYSRLTIQKSRSKERTFEDFLEHADEWIVGGSDNTHSFIVNGKRTQGTKTTAFEVLDTDKIAHDAYTKPFRAGLCLKYENMKNRVLLAQQFDSYVNQAYCLYWVDGAWQDYNHIGLPRDRDSAIVARHRINNAVRDFGTVKLCLDAADYNKQHDLSDMESIWKF